MAIPNEDKPVRHPQKKFFHKKKFCRFCTDSNIKIDYKNLAIINNFVTERGKIMPGELPVIVPITKEN